jgi:hypothetical protein
MHFCELALTRWWVGGSVQKFDGVKKIGGGQIRFLHRFFDEQCQFFYEQYRFFLEIGGG